MLDESTLVTLQSEKKTEINHFHAWHACVYGKKNIIIELEINMDVFRKKTKNKRDLEHV